MIELMFASILPEVIKTLIIAVFCFVLVIIADAVDLIVALRKAKREGKIRHSYGWQRTLEKILTHSSLMFLMLLIDMCTLLILDYFNYEALPFLTILTAMVIIYIQQKSVREKTDEKIKNRMDAAPHEMVKNLKEINKAIKEVREMAQRQ